MLSRWQGWVAALVATLVTGVLVILEVTDGGLRRWWAGHALTTDTVGGLLVLLITVLVADQVVRLRQIKDRARALTATARTPGQADYPAARLDDAVKRLRAASTPLLQVLEPEIRLVVLGTNPTNPAERLAAGRRYTKNFRARPACSGHTRQKHRLGAFRLLGCRPSWGVTRV